MNKICLSLWIKQSMHLTTLVICMSICLSFAVSLFSLPSSSPLPFWDADWIWKNHTICNPGFGAKVMLSTTSLIVFNILRDKTPAYLASLISTHEPRRTLRSTDRGLLNVPRHNLERYGRRSFSCARPTLWNTLPTDTVHEQIKPSIFLICLECQWGTTITVQLGSLCRLLRIPDVCKMRHRFANMLWNACLNHPTISCWTRMTPKPHTYLNMDTVWYVRQCGGIICTLMDIYNRWNVDWWPDDRFAGSMPERMFKIIYSSP